VSGEALLLPIHGQTYALPLDDVEAVMQAEPPTPLPGLPPPILGMVQARGRVIVVADAGLLLAPGAEPPRRPPSAGEVFVVLARLGEGMAVSTMAPLGVVNGLAPRASGGEGSARAPARAWEPLADPLPLDAAMLMAALASIRAVARR
jgi:purine-binding chemotaxis protein CheW